VEDRSCRDRVLVAAGGALVDARPGVKLVGFPVPAAVANEALGPAEVGKGFDAGSFIRVGVAKRQKTTHCARVSYVCRLVKLYICRYMLDYVSGRLYGWLVRA